MMKKIMGVLIIMGILSFLTGCAGGLGEKGSNGIGKKAKDNESGIQSFKFYYNNSFGASSYSWDVTEEEGKIIFTYESMQHEEFGEMMMECGQEIPDSLYGIYKDIRIAEWDGYDKYNPNVLDGDGFSLIIMFKDGTKMSAHGSNACPERYGDFENAIIEVLEPLQEKILGMKRRELIDKGINGDLDSIMVHFIQHGTSGRDEYSFFIINDSYRENNCEIKIKSYSENIFTEGNYNKYIHVPYSEIDFSPVRKMIDDYNILEWYDYDKAADDYNNSEWFQVHFGFSDGLNINACGTEHPENYDEFRTAFINWMKEVYKKYDKNDKAEEQ